MACTLLVDASLLDNYWHETVQTANDLTNRLPTPILQGFSPYHKLFTKPPNYDFLRVFGCLSFLDITPYTKHKLQPHSVRCVLLGYAQIIRLTNVWSQSLGVSILAGTLFFMSIFLLMQKY